MVDFVRLAPDSFRTIYLRREDDIILRTESGRRIIIKKIIPEEWKEYRLYDYEHAINENKKEIFLFDRRYLPQLSEEFEKSLRND